MANFEGACSSFLYLYSEKGSQAITRVSKSLAPSAFKAVPSCDTTELQLFEILANLVEA